MADFLSKAVGSSGVAKLAGQKVGELVEDTVEKVLGGGNKTEEEKGEAGGNKNDNKGGFDVGDALNLVGGNKDDNKGGFGVGDALALVGGNKDGQGDGQGVKSALGGLFG